MDYGYVLNLNSIIDHIIINIIYIYYLFYNTYSNKHFPVSIVYSRTNLFQKQIAYTLYLIIIILLNYYLPILFKSIWCIVV